MECENASSMSFLGKLDLLNLRATIAFPASRRFAAVAITKKHLAGLDVSQVLRLLLELGKILGGR
jgi:hypothetical protein